MAGGLAIGRSSVIVQGLELLALALLAADAKGLRQRIPLLSSPDKALAAGGWVLLVAAAVALDLALPEL